MSNQTSSTLPLRPMEQPQEHSRFTINSGYLCYGDLHNIHHGATSSAQTFPPPGPERSGTVIIHKLKPCVPALTGTWATYQLIDDDRVVRAWFACYSSVEPEKEITKILRVSGSPYESWSGSSRNNSKTAEEGVLVVNRYDWGWYDNRGKKDLGMGDDDVTFPPCSVGLADREIAEEQALLWKDCPAEQRVTVEGGVWLFIPHAEYLFGRFGYDDEHVAVRSFLFFTEGTDFMRTSFRGLSHPLRKLQTEEELFLDALNRGEKFEGLRKWEDIYGVNQCPPESECIGPFDSSEGFLEPSDWDALREYAEVRENTSVRTFAEPLKETILALLDDLALTCLSRFVEHLPSASSVQEFTNAFLPKHGEHSTMDSHCYPYLTVVKEKDIPGFNVAGVESRMRSFLVRHCGEHALLDDSDFMAGVRQYSIHPLSLPRFLDL